MTQLARKGILAMAKEVTPGTFLAPTVSLPYTGNSTLEDMVTILRDESVRGDDSVLHGVYQGPIHSEWAIDLAAYPDLIGHMLAATVGPDTVTPGVTTTLSAATIVGATVISTPVALAAGAVIQLDTAGLQEYCWADGASTGAGPYTTNVTTVLGKTGANRVGLQFAHASAVAAVTQTTHTFKQNPAIALPTYSFLYYDTVQWVSTSYGRFSELGVKIDTKATITLSAKALAMPSVPNSQATAAYTTYDPLLGWSWNMTAGGASSTRGLTADATFKRAVEAIDGSDGTQAPREIFAGALEYDATLKAIYENTTDLNLYLQNTQLPFTVSAQQPVVRGGQSLTLTSSKSAWTKGKRDLGQAYSQADYSISGIQNTTDGGVVQAVLTNWQTTAY